MSPGRYWMRLSRFFTMAASWSGVPQAARFPRRPARLQASPDHRVRSLRCTALTVREAAMQHGGAAETPAAGGQSAGPGLGVGHYESTAEQIPPAARAVVDAAAIGTGEHVLDLGCGTGNAALLAAEHTGRVTGVDPARGCCRWHGPGRPARGRRWISFRGRRIAAGWRCQCGCHRAGARGDLRARSGRRRQRDVTGAGSRRAYRAERLDPRRGHLRDDRGGSRRCPAAVGAPAPEPSAWHDRNALASLLGPYGVGVGAGQHSVAFSASSVQQFLDQETQKPPLAVAVLRILGQLGQAEALRLTPWSPGSTEH